MLKVSITIQAHQDDGLGRVRAGRAIGLSAWDLKHVDGFCRYTLELAEVPEALLM